MSRFFFTAVWALTCIAIAVFVSGSISMYGWPFSGCIEENQFWGWLGNGCQHHWPEFFRGLSFVFFFTVALPKSSWLGWAAYAITLALSFLGGVYNLSYGAFRGVASAQEFLDATYLDVPLLVGATVGALVGVGVIRIAERYSIISSV